MPPCHYNQLRLGFPGLRRRHFPLVAAFFAVFLGVVSGLFPGHARAESSVGPLFDQFRLTLEEGERTEAIGPLYYQQQSGAQASWAISPLMSSWRDPETESWEFDFLFPAITHSRVGAEYRFQIFQMFSIAGGGLQSGGTKDRFTLFPIYFQQRSANTNLNYTALLPLYGKLRNRLFRDEIDFVLWPLYVKTKRRPGAGTVGAEEFMSLGGRWAQVRRGDMTTYNFLTPIFHLRYGDGMSGWQVWPLASHELKAITTRTNAWGDVETVAGYEKSFLLWPLWNSEDRNLGTTNESHYSALLPFYTKLRSPPRDSTTYLWPVGLTLTDDRARKYRETDLLWPVFVYARGEGKTATRFWPLFGRAHNDVLERNFYLWPVYKYTHLHSDPLDRERTQILFFLYSDVRQKSTETGKDSHRVDFWPFFTHARDFEGNTRLQVLSIVEPILSKSRSVERNYSPLWSLWRSENNPVSGASSQSLLWNLYRRQMAPDGSRKTSCLFGLFQRRTTAEGSALRLFYIPVKNPHRTHAADVSKKVAFSPSPNGRSSPSPTAPATTTPLPSSAIPKAASGRGT